MKILSLFNNKGGVGKTTLTYHLAHILSESVENGGFGKKVLLMDLDPQCNLTIFALQEELVAKLWKAEEPFLDNGSYAHAKRDMKKEDFNKIMNQSRTVHFLLKPTEDGLSNEEILPPPFEITATLAIIPGRLSLYKYEATIARSWSGVFLGEPLAIRTITRIREIAKLYSKKYEYDYVIMDTSPSLGALNKVIISMADGFIIPCLPDLFSFYGIRNIGESLKSWQKEFSTILQFVPKSLTEDIPSHFVQFLGYTIFNAKKYSGKKQLNDWNLSQGHYNYAKAFPDAILASILTAKLLPPDMMESPIGKTSIMHSHNTFPSQAQKYKCPIWELPKAELDKEDKGTIIGNKAKYEAIKKAYFEFTQSLLERVAYLDK